MQSRDSKLFLLARPVCALLHELSKSARLWLMSNCIRPTKSLKSFMEAPLNSFLNRLIEYEREKRHSGQTQLSDLISFLGNASSLANTHSNRSVRPYCRILRILQCSSRIPHDTMYSESRQAHTRYALEYRPLHHYASEILNGRHVPGFKLPFWCRQWLPRIC